MIVCACDAETSIDVCSDMMRKARKQHTCAECGKIIEPGETYRIIKGIVEDTAFFHKQCSFCAGVAKDLVSYGYCFALGDLWEMVREIEEGVKS